jgi:hypothetical protein
LRGPVSLCFSRVLVKISSRSSGGSEQVIPSNKPRLEHKHTVCKKFIQFFEFLIGGHGSKPLSTKITHFSQCYSRIGCGWFKFMKNPQKLLIFLNAIHELAVAGLNL